jgi:DNA-binding response OmpR family regulator
VLLVEPYLPLAKPLLRGLAEEGIVAHLARDDAEADALARATRYAVAVVAWNVPRNGGAALVRGWRRAGLAVPVFMFLPSDRDDFRLEGTEAGVDEFLLLPFSIADLAARLRPWARPARP